MFTGMDSTQLPNLEVWDTAATGTEHLAFSNDCAPIQLIWLKNGTKYVHLPATATEGKRIKIVVKDNISGSSGVVQLRTVGNAVLRTVPANTWADIIYASNNPKVPSSRGKWIVIGYGSCSDSLGLPYNGINLGNSTNSAGSYSINLGDANFTNNDYGIAIGYGNTSGASASVAIGNSTGATGTYSVAIGGTSLAGASYATGAGSVALGGAYVTGVDSFGVSIADTTTSYGAQVANSIAMGYHAVANGGYYDIAIGAFCVAQSNYGVAVGAYATASAAGGGSMALGSSVTSDGTGALALGYAVGAHSPYSLAIGSYTITDAASAYSSAIGYGSATYGIASTALGYYAICREQGKLAYASGYFAVQGDRQNGKFLLASSTTTSTATTMTTDLSAASTLNQVILQDNSLFMYSGMIVAKQVGTTNIAVWKVQGAIYRGTGAASTVLSTNTTSVVVNTPGWGIALTADTTYGGLSVKFTGIAGANIKATALIETVELIN